MTVRRVLSIGQCGPDQAAISRFLHAAFVVSIDLADTAVEAMSKQADSTYDLVLVNRKLDVDYSDGMEIIRLMKHDARLAKVPVMLVSNYREYQQNAVAIGAQMGFGKQELGQSSTVALLEPFLGKPDEPEEDPQQDA